MWCESYGDWDWFLDRSNDSLYGRNAEGGIDRYRRKPGRASHYALGCFEWAEPAQDIPLSTVRATVEKQGSLWVVRSTDIHQVAHPHSSGPKDEEAPTLTQAIASLPTSIQWAVSDMEFNNLADDGATLAAAIQSPEGAIAVSDGSFKDSMGTACYIIEGPNARGGITCPVVAPGSSKDHSPYRSELTGLLGVAVLIHLLCKVHHIQQGSVTVACNGLAALKSSMEYQDEVPPTTQHFDLIMAIRHWMWQSPVKWTTKHVKGHQDDQPYDVLDRWATLNQAMDTRAKARLALLQQQLRQRTAPATPSAFEGEPWPLYFNGKKVSRDFVQRFYEHVSGPPALYHWKHQVDRFGQGSRKDVDWQAVADGMKLLPPHRQRWITQQAAGWGGVGKWMFRYGEWPHSKCPRCTEPVEDTEHVLLCKGTGAQDLMLKALDDFSLWLQGRNTQADIAEALVNGLHSWYMDTPFDTGELSEELQEVVQTQSRLGWKTLLEGFPATGWAVLQQAYFDRLGSRRTGRRWLASVVKKLLDLAFQMWQHRNDVNNKKETSTISLDVNRQIELEYQLGFRDLDPAARQLGRKPKPRVLQAALSYRKNWLRSIKAARKFQQSQADKRRVPTWVANTIGLYEWIRRGRPPEPSDGREKQQ